MASNPPGSCCVVGVKHEGDPQGKTVKAGQYDAYLATPAPGKAHKDVAILFLTDIFGIWPNSQLLADQFAANGYTTLIIDLFNGDQAPVERGTNFDVMKWLTQGTSGSNPHTTDYIDPIVVAGIKALKEEYGAKKVGAVAYCFGGKYLCRHYKSGIDVGYTAHPSFVDEDELASITGPLSIAAAETDTIFTVEKRHRSEEILRTLNVPYQINLFQGVEHGFTVRGDPKVRADRFGKEQAFLQAVAWFNEFLL